MLAILKAQDVGKAYESGLIFKKQHIVLQGITLAVNEGKTLGLMGVSGSGKTTLGMMLAGLERPTSGRVLFAGKDLASMRGPEFLAFRRQVQMVFQDPEGSLNPRKSIEKSIHEVLSLLKIPPREWRDRTGEILETVGLSEELLCRYPAQISGGQCQRLALGRVLLLQPTVIILDEPTSALDISVQAQILNLLRDLQRDLGLAYLLISHQPEVIRFMAHETIILESERTLEEKAKRRWI
ncbi:MAG: dipeptide/oligopeptide/nickel ABC transporter ATP-binding protein [Methanothrix sp.]|jgi:peptide/nickel transport system ATP-binding protein|nr:dipeptide/oligopeptide/nickel ABC transporter ATP-binding protein [Methanothrix sp.]